ncbi:hypothetical protein Gpo141_00000177 [Globisporangium polare]
MSSSGKRVLEEDEYVAQLEQLIERDFFPELPALRKQQALLNGESGAAGSQLTATTFRGAGARAAASSVGSASVRSRHESSSWDQPTPTRHDQLVAFDQRQQNDAESDEMQERNESSGAEMTLNRFVATHTSEDNESFNVLQEKTVEDHKQRYHWAYDVDESRGDPKLHLLSDGSWISKEQRRLVDEVCAPKGLLDNRPSAPDTWKFRARNPLLFPPELTETRDICQVQPNLNDPLLLEDGANSRLGRPAKAKKVTVYANSRFPSTEDDKGKAAAVGLATALDDYSLVQMTPSIVPGVDASPLMTWGDIEGTPMLLDARATPERILSCPTFEVKETSSREKLANRLEAQTRLRKSKSKNVATALDSALRKRPFGETSSTPGARSVRERLTNIRSSARTPLFGGDSELRASYSTPLRLPPRHQQQQPTTTSGSSSARPAAKAARKPT